ncbi:preprotein translocase subunit Sec61beta [Candidatus Bathyarchaeota archaeon]|nr:preprotein translocase subunit Sec61beta [Candidatus Bathyarchaeota archaeon]MBS7630789.1 preprotein translocase subunit Sec61beta [Candidatus Bathyarchaeota archaeon]
MSRKRRDSAATMPASSAGLMRFFQDEAQGIKISPEIVVAASIILMLAVILAHTFYPISV